MSGTPPRWGRWSPMHTSAANPPVCDDRPDGSRLGGRSTVTRRSLLAGGAAATTGLLVAACASAPDESKTEKRNRETGPSVNAASDGDLELATTAVKLEYLATDTYRKLGMALDRKALGKFPRAVARYVRVAHDQHQAAEDRWNRVLTESGQEALNEPPTGDLTDEAENMFESAKNWRDVAKLALLVEQTTADTYLHALTVLKGKDLITLAGSLQVIAQQHQAIVHFVLGEYPVPDVFQQTDYAYGG